MEAEAGALVCVGITLHHRGWTMPVAGTTGCALATLREKRLTSLSGHVAENGNMTGQGLLLSFYVADIELCKLKARDQSRLSMACDQ